ncbi:MAG TPA: glycoside hydrolase family 3 N-terminal domain-containing protein [Planctomycetota bacterium]
MKPRLSPREKVAQMVCADFRFELPDYERITAAVKAGVGGVCLFGGSIYDVASFVNGLQNLAKFPLLVASDYEDGAGRQVSGATVLPSNMAVGATGSEALAELKGRVTAREATALGVRWVLAPVLDLQVRADNPIVNTRSFGADAGLVTRLGRAFARGVQAEGALACGKHFPGHGDVSTDSHLELPVLDDPGPGLAPFRDVAEELDSIMVGHLVVKSADPGRPATLSSKVVDGLLRDGLGYGGLVATDALMMGAIVKTSAATEAVVRAAEAGNDVLLYPLDPLAAIDALEKALESGRLNEGRVDRAVARIFDAKRKCGLTENRIADPGAVERIVGRDEHLKAADRIAEASVTKLRGEFPVRKARLELVTDGGTELTVFRDELERRGVLSTDSDVVVIALSSRVRAFRGKVGIDPKVLANSRARLAGARRIVAISFGNPYVHRDVASDAAMCVYDDSEASQRAAARALAGEIPMPGTLPVTL